MNSDPAFVEAVWQLSEERGFGYHARSDVEARAELIRRAPPRVRLPPLPIILPPLPPILPPLPF